MSLGPPPGVTLETYALVRALAFISATVKASKGAPYAVVAQARDIQNTVREALFQRSDLEAAYGAYTDLKKILGASA